MGWQCIASRKVGLLNCLRIISLMILLSKNSTLEITFFFFCFNNFFVESFILNAPSPNFLCHYGHYSPTYHFLLTICCYPFLTFCLNLHVFTCFFVHFNYIACKFGQNRVLFIGVNDRFLHFYLFHLNKKSKIWQYFHIFDTSI